VIIEFADMVVVEDFTSTMESLIPDVLSGAVKSVLSTPQMASTSTSTSSQLEYTVIDKNEVTYVNVVFYCKKKSILMARLFAFFGKPTDLYTRRFGPWYKP